VDYADLFRHAIACNRHHFTESLVVTAPHDLPTQQLAAEFDLMLHITDAFYRDDAYFNKYRALEEGLDLFGRSDWMLILDADIFLPQQLPPYDYQVGKLYTPLRRMIPGLPLPVEDDWKTFPYCEWQAEWSGYFHLFHADDPHLPEGHWYETTWKHAGGADSMLERRWGLKDKVRPLFDVAHVGPGGHNWCGVGNKDTLDAMMRGRRKRRRKGGDLFAEERIDGRGKGS
jgi:hypothetical protein